MNDNIVKLVFNAVAAGGGWSDVSKKLKTILGDSGKLAQGIGALGPAFGTFGMAAGKAISMLMQGGVWGFAAEGIKFVINELGLFKDKSEETKKKIDQLAEASRKYYATIKENSSKALDKIDAETKRRNEQLDITNRMIKAELQLQKAKAIYAGDVQTVESIDRQMAGADQATAMDKAVGSERDADRRVKVKEAELAAAKKAVREAKDELAKAEEAVRKNAIRPNQNQVFVGGPGGMAAYQSARSKGVTYRESDLAAAKAARERLALAEQATDAAQKSVESEREKWKLARDGVKALKAEQKAANEESAAKRMAADMKAEKERVAAEKKAVNDFAEAERKRKEKDAEDQLEREKEALDEEIRKRNEARKSDLQKDIEANRQRAASLEQALGAAMDRVRETHDVLGNAAGMDQAAGVSAKRRDFINNSRFASGAADLIESGKIKQGKDGVWRANGRLSNLNQAILDRLNAEKNRKNVEKEQDKVVKKLDELINELKQMTTI